MVNSDYTIEKMPKESSGECINSRNCKQIAVFLADGWCINCWDKSEESKINILKYKQRREERRIKALKKKAVKRND